MEDKVSIIMSVYNEDKEQLKSSIESILNQTYKNIEFIIILDNPCEYWKENFIKSYKDNRIKFFINQKNIGLTKSLNKALKETTGNYIARMDADDISMPERIEKQLDFLKKNNYDLVGCNMRVFFNKNDKYVAHYPEHPQYVKKMLKINNCVPHPTWLAKKEVFEKNLGYREVFSCEDYDFIIRAITKGFKIANCQEILFKYRLSINSISRSNAGKQELIAEYIKNNYKKGIVVSIDKLEDYYNSKKFQKKLKSYNNYYKIKNKRIREKNKKFPMYYIYSVIIIFNLNFFVKDLMHKLIIKYILIKDKRKKKNEENKEYNKE